MRTPELTWFAFLSIIALIAASLWDKGEQYAVAGLYLLGLIAGGIILRQLRLTGNDYAWWAAMLLAAYTLVVALFWHQREQLIRFAAQLGFHGDRRRRDQPQMVICGDGRRGCHNQHDRVLDQSGCS